MAFERVRASVDGAGVAPGIVVAVAIAAVAKFLAAVLHGVPDVLIALAIGILLRNLFGASWTVPGSKWVVRYVLRAAIILIGGGLTLSTVASRGTAVLGLVAALFVMAFALGIGLARLWRLPSTMGILIGAGTAICGASAILVVSPLIRAREEETAYAIATVFTFNLIALALYPVIGHWLDLSQSAFGTWAGTSVNDTSVVIATGFAYGPAAGAVATVTKLIRTVLLLPLAVGIGLAFARGQEGAVGLGQSMRRAVPWFVAGFVAMAALHTTGILPASVFALTSAAASFMIVVVLAGVGLGVELRSLTSQGVKPLAIGLALGTVMGAVSLAAAMTPL